MKKYARLDKDDNIISWPVFEIHIKNSGLPERFFEEVTETPAPNYNKRTHDVIQSYPKRNSKGLLQTTWDIVPRSEDNIKKVLIDELAEYRWNKETGGLELPNGESISTTREAQSQINGAFSSLTSGLIDSVEWKSGEKWITVDINHFAPITAMVAQHVQKCFSTEKKLAFEISELTSIEDLSNYDISERFETVYSTR